VSDTEFAAGLILGAIIGALVAGVVTYHTSIDGLRGEAVKQGVAEYYLDSEHDKQFRWKPRKE
jgi:hypothetical protein